MTVGAVGAFERPRSLTRCRKRGGGIDKKKCFDYRRHINNLCCSYVVENVEENVEEDRHEPPKKKTRNRRKGVVEHYDEDGNRKHLAPNQSSWYTLCVIGSSNPNKSNRFYKKFRRRFRLPCQQHLELVEEARRENWFPRWTSKDATGKDSSPLELMMLGALRCLGRGWTFDDLEEATAIAEDVHRCFFHSFIHIGSTVLFDKHVITPTHQADAITHMHEMTQAGFPGCPGSTDATNIVSIFREKTKKS